MYTYMKHFLPLLLIFFVAQGAGKSLFAQDNSNNIIDEVIWVIGDDAILLSDVEETRLAMQRYDQRIPGDPYCVIPEQIAIQKLFLHQAKLDSIEVGDSQIFQEVEAQLNYQINMAGSKERLEDLTGKSINAMREDLKQRIREEQTVRMMKRELVKNVKITPSDVRAYYNRIPQDSLPYIPATVEVEIVTKEPAVSLAEIDDIKGRLRDYTEQVTSGKMQFSSLARLWSEDKESAMRGGELGFQGKGVLMPEFAAVAFDLNDPKRVSRIVETEYGFHIIQLIEKRGDRINVRHILLKPRISNEELNAAVQRLDSIRNDIIEKKYTFEEVALYYSDDKDTRNNKGLMVNNNTNNYNERTGTSRFEMSDLPPEIGKVIEEMQVGDISKPFTMLNSKQKDVAAFVRLKSRTPGHKASLSSDFQALRAMAEAEKQEDVLNKWISKKQKETYIRIKDEWKNCDFQRDGWIK